MRTIPALACLGFILLLVRIPDLAAQNAPVTTCATVGATEPGNVSIPITVVNFNNIGAISLSLDYDYSVAQFVSGTPHPQLAGFAIGDLDLGNGMHRISMGWYGSGTSLPDSSAIMTLTFHYTAGTTELSWYDNGPSCEYADANINVLNDIPTEDYYHNGWICGGMPPPGPIAGDTAVCTGEQGKLYSVDAVANADGYTWTVPPGAAITAGWNSPVITVGFPAGAVTGEVSVYAYNSCTATDTAFLPVMVAEPPVADAGEDLLIPYGTSTTLQAAAGGNGTYSYYWTPEDLLVNPFVQNPQTVNLSSSVVFTLLVTDLATLCESTDQVAVIITGGPLSVNPVAVPGSICAGEGAQLFANAGGGSGIYTYNWTSIPAGNPPWTSTLPDPLINPDTTTLYVLTVDDGFNTVMGTAGITVFPVPPTPEITVQGNLLTSSACCGNQWYLDHQPVPGATGQSYTALVSGMYYDIVTLDECSSDTSEVVDITVGISESKEKTFKIYPNPASKIVIIEPGPQNSGMILARLFSLEGHFILSSCRPDPLNRAFILYLGDILPGIYILEVQSLEEKSVHKLVIL